MKNTILFTLSFALIVGTLLLFNIILYVPTVDASTNDAERDKYIHFNELVEDETLSRDAWFNDGRTISFDSNNFLLHDYIDSNVNVLLEFECSGTNSLLYRYNGFTNDHGKIITNGTLVDIGKCINGTSEFIVDGFSSFGVTDSDLLEGLISYWKFDEDAGSIAFDSHSNNDGTLSNERIFTSNIGTSGIINSGADFTQGDDYITLPSNFGSNNINTRSFSISTWINVDSLPFDTNPFLSIQLDTSGSTGSSNRGIGLWIRDSGELTFFNGRGSTSLRTIETSSSTISTNQWYHIVAVSDGNTGYIYVNGVEIATGSFFDGDITWSTSTSGMGRWDRGGELIYFDGFIDEPAIWDRALSSDEVEALYFEGDGIQYPFTELAEFIPPSVRTDPADLISFNAAQLNGELLDMGNTASVNATFEYWQTQTPQVTFELTTDELTSPQPFSRTVSNLDSNTSYTYRMLAYYDGNQQVVKGDNETFVTLPQPPTQLHNITADQVQIDPDTSNVTLFVEFSGEEYDDQILNLTLFRHDINENTTETVGHFIRDLPSHAQPCTEEICVDDASTDYIAITYTPSLLFPPASRYDAQGQIIDETDDTIIDTLFIEQVFIVTGFIHDDDLFSFLECTILNDNLTFALYVFVWIIMFGIFLFSVLFDSILGSILATFGMVTLSIMLTACTPVIGGVILLAVLTIGLGVLANIEIRGSKW